MVTVVINQVTVAPPVTIRDAEALEEGVLYLDCVGDPVIRFGPTLVCLRNTNYRLELTVHPADDYHGGPYTPAPSDYRVTLHN